MKSPLRQRLEDEAAMCGVPMGRLTVLSSQRSLIDVKSRRLTAVNALLKNVAGRWEALPPA